MLRSRYSSPAIYGRNIATFRRVFEVGSGAIKAQVSIMNSNEVEHGALKNIAIQKTIYTRNIQLLSQASLSEKTENGKQRISQNVIKSGSDALADLIQETDQLIDSGQSYSSLGIATQAFRIAVNGENIMNEFQQQFGFPFKIISKQEEARLGYLTARACLNQTLQEHEDDFISWDCGAGSFQFSSLIDHHSDCHGSGTVHKLSQQLLSSSTSSLLSNDNHYQNKLCTEIEKHLLPMPKWITNHQRFLHYHHNENILPFVIAIGSQKSIFNQQRILCNNGNFDKSFFTQNDVENVLNKLSTLNSRNDIFEYEKSCYSNFLLTPSNSSITSYIPSFENASYLIPKLCLLLSIMRNGNIQQVNYFETHGNCDALLTHPNLWRDNDDNKNNDNDDDDDDEGKQQRNNELGKDKISDLKYSHNNTKEKEETVFAKNEFITVNWHLEKSCNYKCKFCYAHFEESKGNLDLEDGLKLINQLALAGVYKVNFAGGEPFLNHHLGEYIKHAKAIGLKTSIITNASHMTQGWLLSYGHYLDQIGISCDSLNDMTNKALGRGFGQHVLITMRALKRIQALNKNKITNINIKLNTVVMEPNKNENWSKFIIDNGIDRWKIFKILKIEGENDKYYDELKISENDFSNFIKRHKHLKNVVTIASENNDEMTNSYIMITPDGKFYQNSNGKYHHSSSILNVGVEVALSQAGFDYTKFKTRGGVYTL